MRIKPLISRLGLLTMTTVSALATFVACNSGSAPEIEDIPDVIAQVGVELRLELRGSDPDGGRLSYSYADDIEQDIDAELTVSPSGYGVFRWTPLATELGEHYFDFTVSDGDMSSTITVKIDVAGAVGSATAPIFRAPTGRGTELNLTIRECLDLAVMVQDQDTPTVDIDIVDAPDGMEYEETGNNEGNIHWCPTREQASEDLFTIQIRANDQQNPAVLKPYTIDIRDGDGENCPGLAPVVQHTPAPANTILDLTLDIVVTDDKGLKEAPLLYYSTTDPGPNPDLGLTMQQVQMLEISGTPTNAVYAADVPNPVASDPAGTVRTLYYVIVADDDDDEMGDCDHTTQTQVYQMQVTSSGSANLGICATCSADAQCGNGDICAYVGADSMSYCLQACTGGCPAGYTCSNDPVYSIDGNTATQCVPINGSCSAPTADCADDDNEDDDNQSQASANATTDGPWDGLGTDAVLCPKKVQPPSGSKADDDWRQIKIETDTLVDMYLEGSGESDIDLVLYDSSGGLVSKSTTIGSVEQIAQKCLKPATYYVKVNGFDNARTTYYVDMIQDTPEGGSCNTCTDDVFEDDNTFGQARAPTSFPYTQATNKVCPGNDDWIRVSANAGQKIITDLTFVHANGDLDIHVYSDGFTDETPCSPSNIGDCQSDNGQSAAAPEHMEFTAPATQDYWVVVRGWLPTTTNSYGITIKVQ